MPHLELIITADTLEDEEIRWTVWLVVFLAGIICGATADLASLWLFAHWVG